MGEYDNPLDRISSGPAPQGPQPWRSNRLPTGSPYANGRYGTGHTKRRRSRGRSGWVILVVAVVFIAGAIGWAAVSRPDSSPSAVPPLTRGADTAVPPSPPSVDQITTSSLFTTALVTPRCALPAWSTDPAAIEAFSGAGTRCLEQVWRLPPNTVRVFSDPNGVAPGNDCPVGWTIRTVSSCGSATFVNRDGIVAAAGNQAAAALQWLSLSVASRAESRSGVGTDVEALVRDAGGAPSPLGSEYLRREHMQTLCLSGSTIARLAGTAITEGDLERAAMDAATFTVVADLPDAPQLSRTNTRAWFDRGSRSPNQGPCGTAWTVPVDQIS